MVTQRSHTPNTCPEKGPPYFLFEVLGYAHPGVDGGTRGLIPQGPCVLSTMILTLPGSVWTYLNQ